MSASTAWRTCRGRAAVGAVVQAGEGAGQVGAGHRDGAGDALGRPHPAQPGQQGGGVAGGEVGPGRKDQAVGVGRGADEHRVHGCERHRLGHAAPDRSGVVPGGCRGRPSSSAAGVFSRG